MEAALKAKYNALRAQIAQRTPNLALFKHFWLSHDEFIETVKRINERCFEAAAQSQSDHYLCFAVRHNTDKNLLWKAYVKILLMKRSVVDDEITPSSFRIMNFGQYMKFLSSIEPLLNAIEQNKDKSDDSLLIDSFENSVIESGECLICFERKPDALLTCAHAFCQICADKLQQTQQSHEFQCPLCRETVAPNTEWILPGEKVTSNTAIHDYLLTHFT
uniref:RING-type domain-containing protein n=1 Tax=Panagrellus redivivus TaxID=6233 RepID=A0A7E4V251_PANRE